jgi:O-antigen ligase
MLSRFTQNDYDSVTRSRRKDALEDRHAIAKDWPAKAESGPVDDRKDSLTNKPPSTVNLKTSDDHKPETTLLKRGHTLTYAALFLFTVVLYARPAEIYPSAITNSIALIIGIATLAFFVPSQLALEGTPTARPPEVNFVLLFFLTGLLSIPLALNRLEAWQEFNGTFVRCVVIFIVIVNVVRSTTRLKTLMLLALVVSVWLSFGAINDYRLGLMTVEGYRVGGRGGGIFGNSNDMALHLVTIVPIAVALLLGSRSLVRKSLYGGCAVLMVAAIALTYSRGAFIGLLVALLFMAWRVAPRRRLEIFIGGVVLVAAFLAIAPGGYALRLASIFVPSLDPLGSSDARRGELLRSLYVAIRHPLLGIGMGNYQPEMSHRGLVTHNSYTQVAAEMGVAALVCYLLFIITPLRKLGQIARETFEVRSNSHFYYLAVGLQASLLGYMVSSFFASVAYLWYVFYLVGYAVCLRRLYESETGKVVVVEKRKDRKSKDVPVASLIDRQGRTVTT